MIINFVSILIILKLNILWHPVLVILNEVVYEHEYILNTFLVLDITGGILYEVEIVYHLIQLLI